MSELFTSRGTRFRKWAVVVLVAVLTAGLVGLPAEAGQKKRKRPKPAPVRIERIVEFEYQCPCGVNGVVGWQFGESTGENIGGGAFPTTPEDLFLTAKMEDQSGQKVYVALSHDTNGDGLDDTWGTFCSETAEPIPVSQAEAVIRVLIYNGTCLDGTPSQPLQGIITFTLSNLP